MNLAYFTKKILMMTSSLLAVVLSTSVWGATLSKIRVGQSIDNTRVVLEIKKNHRFDIKRMTNPERIVVNLYRTDSQIAFKHKKMLDQRVKSIRINKLTEKIQVVLDLRKAFGYTYFVLSKNEQGAERVVIDVKQTLSTLTTPAKKLKAKKTVKPTTLAKRLAKKSAVNDRSLAQNLLNKPANPLVKRKELVIAIDAGHGGKDVGATGHHLKVYEKHVTLRLAKVLKKYIDKQPGMRAVLTRTDDSFIYLKRRVQIARQKKADIFISLHADSNSSERVKGGTVYILSTNGASSAMAQLLANSENAALVSGPHDEHVKDIAFALSDLRLEANVAASKKLATAILGEMSKKVLLSRSTVQSADFAVLKSMSMPSLLIETAFLSNAKEERKLLNREFHVRLAKSIVSGLKRFSKRKPALPLWGETLYVQYRVKRGDTLSEIANNYAVSTRVLRKLNHIKNTDDLRVGKKLRIPLSEKLIAQL